LKLRQNPGLTISVDFTHEISYTFHTHTHIFWP